MLEVFRHQVTWWIEHLTPNLGYINPRFSKLVSLCRLIEIHQLVCSSENDTMFYDGGCFIFAILWGFVNALPPLETVSGMTLAKNLPLLRSRRITLLLFRFIKLFMSLENLFGGKQTMIFLLG